MADDREPDRLEGGHGFSVGRVGPPCVGEFVDPVEFAPRKRHCRGVLDDDGLRVRLGYGTAPEGVLLVVVQCKRMGIGVAVLLYLRITGEDRVSGPLHAPPCLQVDPVGGAGDVGEGVYALPGGEPVRDGDHLPFAHAEDEEVGGGVGKDGLPDRVGPVVVVGEPPEARLDPADDDRRPREEGVDPVGVDEGRPVRPQKSSAGGVDVGIPALQVRRKGVHHRVDVPGRDREEEPWLAEAPEISVAAPIWLGDDADRVPGVPEHPPEERGPEEGVVNVSVPGDEDDVEPVDAEALRLRDRHREELGLTGHGSTRSKTGRSTPIFSSRIRFAEMPTNSMITASMTT